MQKIDTKINAKKFLKTILEKILERIYVKKCYCSLFVALCPGIMYNSNYEVYCF